jgi:hypothetical protein
MKIITKKDESDKEFYNELLYVTTKYNRILVNPRMKMRKVTNSFIFTILMCVLSALMLLYIYLKKNNILVLILIVLIVLLLIITILYLLNALHFIKNEVKESGGSTVDITKTGVRLTKGKKMDFKIGWDDIKYVLINNYSITFIPVKSTFLMIGVNIVHKDDIIKAIKEVKKDSIIIDNSKLYK